MKHRNRLLPPLALLLAAACASSSSSASSGAPPAGGPGNAGASAPGYHLLHKIPIGGEGGWDYLTLDNAARRLYVSRGTRVLVLDPDTEKTVGEIPNTQGVHGVAIAPESHRGFTSNGRSSTITIFDTATLAVLSEVKATGENPDAILYDPATKRVFTFNGRGKNATALESASGAVAGTIPLSGKPESGAADGKGKVFVNIEDKNEIAVLDSRALKVEKVWPIPGCEEPTGLAMDVSRRRLFTVCHNKAMVVLDADSGRAVSTLPIGEGVDAAAFDPATSLAFASNGEGTVTVVREDGPNSFRVVESVQTQRSARTMALDEKTHRIFLSAAEFGPPPAATAEQPRPRPPMVAGSFTILVLGPTPPGR